MKRIQAYLSLIDPRLLRYLKGKPREFIEVFKEREYASEDELIQRVCAGKHPKNYYLNLKSRTIHILQSLAIMSPSRGGGALKKKYDITIKKFTVAQKFLNNGQRTEGIRLIKQVHDDAIEYDFVYMACETSSLLYHEYLYYERNREQAELYAQQAKAYLQDYTAEKNAHYHFYKVNERPGEALRPEDFKKALWEIQQVKGRSLKYKFYEYRLHVLYGFHMGDYTSVVKNCTEALHLFEGEKGVFRSSYQFLWSKCGIAQMALAQYEDAEGSFIAAMPYAPKNSRNDFILRLYTTLNALHAGQYPKAYDIYKKNKHCHDKQIRDEFTIIEGYLCFLIHTGHITIDKPFRLSKYFGEILKTPQNNIAVLVAELLVYLARDRSKFIERIKVAKNNARSLKSKGTERAKLFIKILALIPKANFHPTVLSRLAKKHIETLEAHPIRMGSNVKVEIIPFHVLTRMMMGKTSHNTQI